MIPPVEVMFQVGGIKNVADAFRTIDEALAKLEKASKKTYTATEKDSARSAKASERDSAKATAAINRCVYECGDAVSFEETRTQV